MFAGLSPLPHCVGPDQTQVVRLTTSAFAHPLNRLANPPKFKNNLKVVTRGKIFSFILQDCEDSQRLVV